MERVRQLLADSPQTKEWIIAHASDTVPPGMAWRDREFRRGWRANHDGLTARKSEVTDEAIRSGQRSILRKYIWGGVRDGTLIETIDEHGEVWLRLPAVKKKPYVMTPARAEAIKRMHANRPDPNRLTPEQRSANSRKGWASRTPQERAERAQKIAEGIKRSIPPETLSEIRRKSWQIDPEKRAARIRAMVKGRWHASSE